MKENNRLKEENSLLLDNIADLTIENNHMKRTDKYYQEMIINEQRRVKELTQEIECSNLVIRTQEIINEQLQNKLNKYIEHINIGA